MSMVKFGANMDPLSMLNLQMKTKKLDFHLSEFNWKYNLSQQQEEMLNQVYLFHFIHNL